MKIKFIAITAFLAVALAGCGQVDKPTISEKDTSAQSPAAQIEVQTETAPDNKESVSDENKEAETTTAKIKANVKSTTTRPDEKMKQDTESKINQDEAAAAQETTPTGTEITNDNTPTSQDKITDPVTTEVIVSVTTSASIEVNTNEKSIYERLNRLSYAPYTNDGLPEYILKAPDGTTYQLNFSSNWIWRNGSEEAALTDDIISWLNENAAAVGLTVCEW